MSLLAFAFSIAVPLLEAGGVSPAFELDVRMALAHEFPSLIDNPVPTERSRLDMHAKLQQLREEQAVIRRRIQELRSPHPELKYR